MKKHNINITNATTIDAHGNHTNGNCKKVYIVEKEMVCTSLTDAAEVIGCSLDSVSNVIRGKQRTCRGYHIIDLSKAGEAFPQIVTCLSEIKPSRKANSVVEITKEEAKEFRKWKAEQKANEKAQKRKAKHEAQKAKLMADIDKHQSTAKKFYDKYETHTRMQMRAERKLEALMDKEVM